MSEPDLAGVWSGRDRERQRTTLRAIDGVAPAEVDETLAASAPAPLLRRHAVRSQGASHPKQERDARQAAR